MTSLSMSYVDAVRGGKAASAVLAPELLPGERLLWSGQPQPGLRFSTADAIAMPFSLMWAGFAFFWELTVVRGGAPLFMKLWGIPFVLVGLYLVGGRFFWDAHRRRRTFYGVTESRLLIVTRGRFGEVKAISRAAVGEMAVRSAQDGSGTLCFGRGPACVAAWFEAPGWPGAQAKAPAFEHVDGVRSIYDLIRRTQLLR